MTSSLVGSEMCIRDRSWVQPGDRVESGAAAWRPSPTLRWRAPRAWWQTCLLYTSDAADDM
eukprot:5692554-Prorocentrum_lima.AAC.1